MTGILLIFITAIFFQGIVNRTRSLLSGRKGPGLLQAMKDIVKLLRKGSIISPTTSIIFQIAPTIFLASVLNAILVVPFSDNKAILSFEGDFVFFTYALALGKFFMIIGALDTGSSFQGMGANREALYSLLIEPAFFILVGSFSMLSGHTSFYDIYQSIHFGSYESYLLSLIAAFVLLQIALVECSRVPFDDSKTHLELTMVHEVMILDHSGVDLAIIHIGNSIKFAIYGALVANLFVNSHLPIFPKSDILNDVYQVVAYLGIQILCAIGLGVLESFRARNRMKRNPMLIATLVVMSILIFFGVLIIMKKFTL